MSLLSLFFHRRPPDGLFELADRIYVFDSCFSTEVLHEGLYQLYLHEISNMLHEDFPESSFLAFNFREGERRSQFSKILCELDITVVEYPKQYEGCPLLPLSLVNHFLHLCDTFLTLNNNQNVILLHCERGGWPLLAFLLASLLILKKLYTGERKCLEVVYREAPRGLSHLLSPLNPYPSQIRYLQYISRRNLSENWPPPERALSLDCLILRAIPNFDNKNGCRPIIRIYGRNLLSKDEFLTQMLYSTPRRGRNLQYYHQKQNDVIKIDIQCLVEGDVVLECLHLDIDSEREVMMFRMMFNTAFIRSNILMLNCDNLDILWDSKARFPKSFRAEVLFGDIENVLTPKSPTKMLNGELKGGLPIEAFNKLQELFSGIEWGDGGDDTALWLVKQLSHLNDAKELAILKNKASTQSSPICSEDDNNTPSVADSLDFLESESNSDIVTPSPVNVFNEILEHKTSHSTVDSTVSSPGIDDLLTTETLRSPDQVPLEDVLTDQQPPLPISSFPNTPPPSSPHVSKPPLSPPPRQPQPPTPPPPDGALCHGITSLTTKPPGVPHGAPPPPPPPHGGTGPPPPPGSNSSNGSQQPTPSGEQLRKKTSLKPLHWVKVTRAIQGSLWAETQKQDESRPPEIDFLELECLFSVANVSDRSGARRGLIFPKPKIVQLVDLRRAYNCEIMLTKIKIPLPDVLSAILALDSSALNIDQVENLIKFSPTKEEMEALKKHMAIKEMFGKCELFFMELMKVPRVESKLRVFAFTITFTSQVSDLRRNLSAINDATKEVKESAKLRQIMQTILTLGNALNQGTPRGSAVGFKLDSILKLSDTRARNNKMTLMHYLCKILAEKMPHLLDFDKDLAHLEAASKIQLKTLAEEMQEVSKGLEKVELELTASENDGTVSAGFQKVLKGFLHTAEGEVRALISLYTQVGRNADSLSQYFGEDPVRCPFEQVTQILVVFAKMFKKARDENEQQAEVEKKRLEKEALKEHSSVNKTQGRKVLTP